MRRASRIDSAHQNIVDQLRKCGVCVHSTAAIGSGFPDLIWGYRGFCGLLEVKTPKHGTKPETRKAQEEWRARWSGPVAVVTNWQEAMDEILSVCNSTAKGAA